jgi:hypothetical protein
LRLRAGRKRGSFFVAHVDPFQLLIEPQRIGYRVQAVAHDTVNPFDARLYKSVN